MAVPSPQARTILHLLLGLLYFKKIKLKVTKKYVVYIGDPQQEIIEQYKSMFGKLSTPTKKLIIVMMTKSTYR